MPLPLQACRIVLGCSTNATGLRAPARPGDQACRRKPSPADQKIQRHNGPLVPLTDTASASGTTIPFHGRPLRDMAVNSSRGTSRGGTAGSVPDAVAIPGDGEELAMLDGVHDLPRPGPQVALHDLRMAHAAMVARRATPVPSAQGISAKACRGYPQNASGGLVGRSVVWTMYRSGLQDRRHQGLSWRMLRAGRLPKAQRSILVRTFCVPFKAARRPLAPPTQASRWPGHRLRHPVTVAMRRTCSAQASRKGSRTR